MPRKRKIVIIGTGSEGRIVLDALQEAGEHRDVVGFLDACLPTGEEPQVRRGSPPLLMGLPVLGDAEEMNSLRKKGVSGAVIAFGDNARRAELAEHALAIGWELVPVKHPSAVVARSAKIGAGCILHAGCVIGVEAILGKCVIVNTLASVDHDCVVDDFAQIAPGAHLAGRVRLGRGAFVGIGASIRQGMTVGDGATVGMGAAVVAPVPAGVVVGGVPARRLRIKKGKHGDGNAHRRIGT